MGSFPSRFPFARVFKVDSYKIVGLGSVDHEKFRLSICHSRIHLDNITKQSEIPISLYHHNQKLEPIIQHN